MTNTSIKIVRPWPAEQPRPPVTHRTEATKASSANQERPTTLKRTAAYAAGALGRTPIADFTDFSSALLNLPGRRNVSAAEPEA